MGKKPILIRSYLVQKDIRRRNMTANLEGKKNRLKYYIVATMNNAKRQINYLNKLRSLPKDSSRTRVRNYCIFSGKARSVYSDFHLSRHQIRRLSLSGDLVGIRKSSF